MKFYLLHRLTNYRNSKKIDSFHAAMFHGTADRAGKIPTSENARLEHELDRPLQLYKNAYSIGHVFEPEFVLVISSAVRKALSEISNIVFAPVNFKTLFSYPYHEGDFTFWESNPDYNAQRRLIEKQKDNPAIHEQVGEYFELVSPRVWDLEDRFSPLSKVTVQFNSEDQEEKEVLISQEMLYANPVYSAGYKVMSEAVFSELQPFINWTYYEFAEGSI